MSKAMIVSVGTGKIGEDIAKAISFSIKQQDPKYVAFIISRISKKSTMPFIKENKVMQGRVIDEIEIDDEDNVEQVAIKCIDIIQQKIITKKGFLPEDIVADFTSGTKAMSAGLLLASLNFPGISLSYISGRRDSEGRVISGEETIRIQTPNRIHFNSLFKNSVYLFNKYQFNACLELISKAERLLSDEEYLQRANVLKDVTLAYSFWDRFNHNNALQILKDLTRSDRKKLLFDWGIIGVIERNKQVLHKEINDNYSIEMAVDLLENASRRAEEGKYDDAVARIYRLLEYIAQYRLFTKYGIETKSIDVSKLPEKLRTKYRNYENREEKIALSLFKSYELLKDLNDELGIKFLKDYMNKEGKIKKLLGIRNNSILAHGFYPVDEKEFEVLRETLEGYLRFMTNNLGDLKKKVQFPQIKIF